jgi:hypothetical protein
VRKQRIASVSCFTAVFAGIASNARSNHPGDTAVTEQCSGFRLLWVALLLALSIGPLASVAGADEEAGYPTAARAEYVFACMATNGGNQESLRDCSCVIDVIASVLPYSKYEQAETVLRMRRSAGGYLGEEFRSAISNDMVRDFEEAQAEAEVRCF